MPGKGKPFVKGDKRAGRRPGSLNVATRNAREAIARFVDGNADRLQGWLDEIAAEHGAKAAMECFGAFLEFHVPKLARTEHTGDAGGPIKTVTTVEFVTPKK